MKQTLRVSLCLCVLFSQILRASSDNESFIPYGSAIQQYRYIPWKVYSGCLVKRALSSSLQLCIQGNGDVSKAKTYAQKALSLWLDAIRPLNPKVTREITFGCDHPDGYVNVYSGWGREYASPGTINVFDQSYFGSYLHEFGHAFACLGDTYVGSTAGYCVAGQPHSVMCDGLLRNDLSSDDVEGARNQFRTGN